MGSRQSLCGMCKSPSTTKIIICKNEDEHSRLDYGILDEMGKISGYRGWHLGTDLAAYPCDKCAVNVKKALIRNGTRFIVETKADGYWFADLP